MHRLLSALLVLAATGAPNAGRAQTPGQPDSLAAIEWLIGTWEYRDASVEGGGTYVDAGVRTCGRDLGGSFIVCESFGRTATGIRSYRWHFNWNRNDGRHEMMAVFSDYGRKTLYEIRISDDGRRIDLIAPRYPTPTGSSQSWATLTYDGDRTTVWETRVNTHRDLPDVWPVRFRERATKRPG